MIRVYTLCFSCCRRLSLAYKEHHPQTVAKSSEDSSLSSPIVITHGILGSKTNWSVVASALANAIQQKVNIIISVVAMETDQFWTYLSARCMQWMCVTTEKVITVIG